MLDDRLGGAEAPPTDNAVTRHVHNAGGGMAIRPRATKQSASELGCFSSGYHQRSVERAAAGDQFGFPLVDLVLRRVL